MGRRVVRALALLTTGLGAAAAIPASALALSGPFTIGSGDSPAIAVDGGGTAYVVWQGEGPSSQPTGQVVYCMLPDGASACAHAGVLATGAGSTGFSPGAGEPRVVISGGTVAIVAHTGSAGDNSPIQEWQAPDGTANFSLVNGGDSVADADAQVPVPGHPGSIFVPGLWGAVAVPGSGELGVSFDVNYASPTFAAFPLSNPPPCSYATTPACSFATLGPLSDAPLGATISHTASESGPSPGVLGIRPTADSGPFACPGSQPYGATAFFYGRGLQGPSNDYNVSPGLPNSAWKVGVSPIPNDCSTSEPSIAGGASGFGLMETLLGPDAAGYGTLRYRPFDTATMTFDKPAMPVVSPGLGDSIQLGQDGSGGIYGAMYLYLPPQLLTGQQQPGALRALVYSADGGHTWHGPAPLQPDIVPDSSTLPMAGAVGTDGKGWLVWPQGVSLQAVEFTAADANTPVSAALASPPTATSRTVTLALSCFAVPCQVDTTLTPPASGAADARARKHRVTTLGAAQVTLTRHGRHKVVLHLTAAGRRLVAAHRGSVKVVLTESTTLGGYQQTVSHTISVRLSRRAK